MYRSALYQRSPRLLQELLIGAKSFFYNHTRESGVYSSAVKALDANQWASPEAQKTYQENRLRILREALEGVPYYRSSIERFGDDIHRYPLIDKTIVNEHGAEFINRNSKGLKVSGRTSGTSGQSLQLLKSLDELRWEQAFIHRQIEWAGCHHSERKAWIRGDMIVDANRQQPPYWRKNTIDKKLLMSSYHLSDQNSSAYLQELENFDPSFIQAYPSSIYFLARSLIQSGKIYRGKGLRAIITSSETLLPEMQADITAAFGVPVYDWYGSYERVAAIGTCEHGTRHLLTDYSDTELLPADNGLQEIVGTTFLNLLMPLVRYRTGDFVGGVDRSGSCACKRAYPVIERLVGRSDDSIITPDGKRINRLDHIFKLDLGITESQIRQNTSDTVEVLVVTGKLFKPRNLDIMRDALVERIGTSMRIDIQLVDKIPRTANGKLKSIICNYKPADGR